MILTTNSSKCRSSKRNQKGFTFAEVLAAMVFMGILIPVILEGISLSNKAGVASRRLHQASRLGNNFLHELILNDQWLDAGGSGIFGSAGENEGFSWRLTQKAWPEDTMNLLELQVLYTVQGQTRSVFISTLVDDSE